MKRYVLSGVPLFGIFIALGSCSSNVSKECPDLLAVSDIIRPVEISLPQEETSFFSLVDSLDLFFLSSGSDCLIGQIDDIRITEDRLFIVDRHSAQSIFVFNHSGDYLYSIGRQGRSAGEYQSIAFSMIGPDKITILDSFSLKEIQYGYQGELQHEMPITDFPFYGKYQFESGSSVSVFDVGHPYMLAIQDSSLQSVSYAFPAYPDLNRMPMAAIADNDTLLFHYSQCDTIFAVTDSSILAKYIIDVYDYDTDAYLEQLSAFSRVVDRLRFENSLENDKIVESYIGESKDFFLFNYRKGKSLYSLFYNRNMQESKLVHVATYLPGWDYVSFLPGISVILQEDFVITSMDPISYSKMDAQAKTAFFELISCNDRQKLEAHLANQANNPIVCVFHLKH